MASNYAFYNIITDLAKPQSHEILVKKNDSASRTFVFTVLNNGKKIDLSKVASASIRGVKPDGAIIYDACDVDKATGRIVWTPMTDFTNKPGKITCELDIYETTLVDVSSFEFYITVQNLLFDENDYVSVDDLSGFKAYMARAQASAQYADSVRVAFESTYGDLEEIRRTYVETLDEYTAFFEKMKQDAAEGKFDGARGPQGENGADAVVTEGVWPIGFQIEEGHLICYYVGNVEPEIEVDTDGHLIVNG